MNRIFFGQNRTKYLFGRAQNLNLWKNGAVTQMNEFWKIDIVQLRKCVEFIPDSTFQ